MAFNKDLKQLLKHAKKEGWEWEQRNNGHLTLHGPNGEKVYCSQTPSDRHAAKNVKRDMEKQTKEKTRA